MDDTAFGTLTDYAAGRRVRPATAPGWRRSADASHRSPRNGVFGLDGQAARVDGGPGMNPRRGAIIALLSEAATGGDTGQVRICETAPGIHGQSRDGEIDAARGECVRVILGNRANAAGRRP